MSSDSSIKLSIKKSRKQTYVPKWRRGTKLDNKASALSDIQVNNYGDCFVIGSNS
jgi:hypothetical protein